MSVTLNTNTSDNYFVNIAKKHKNSVKVFHFDGVFNTRIEIIGKGYEEDKYEISKHEKEICDLALQLVCNKCLIKLHESGRERHLLENLWILVNKNHANLLYLHTDVKYGQIKDWKCGVVLELFKLKNKNGKIFIINKNNQFLEVLDTYFNFKISSRIVDHLIEPKEDWIGI